jgi:hypothetical protein
MDETQTNNNTNTAQAASRGKDIQILDQALRFSIVLSVVVALASTLLLDPVFTVSVIFGSAISVANLRVLRWLAVRWINNQREGIMPFLFLKLWGAGFILVAALYLLPLQVEGVIIGMVAALFALLWGASVGGRAVMREATEGSHDA